MEEAIQNKVKNSSLIALDLADFNNKIAIATFDISELLWQGLVLKEKDFRQALKEKDWTEFQGKAVAILCTADAIVPTWAFMLVSSYLSENDIPHLVGSVKELEQKLILENIRSYDISKMENGKFIIKGCSDIPNPALMMSELTKHLFPIASSIMYGEPCSTVPIYKRKRK